MGALLCWLDRCDRKRPFLVIAALVFAHFLLDALVHVPELPLLGANSRKIGLALWNHLPLELALETLKAGAGVVIYWTHGGSKLSRWRVALFTLLLAALTWTQLFVTRAPSPSQLIPNWIVAPWCSELPLISLIENGLPLCKMLSPAKRVQHNLLPASI